MRDQWCRDTAFVVVMLVFSKRRIVQMCPAAADEYIRVRIAGLVALVLAADTASALPPLSEKNRISVLSSCSRCSQGSDQLADVLVDLFDHRGVDRHHVVIAFLLFGRE